MMKRVSSARGTDRIATMIRFVAVGLLLLILPLSAKGAEPGIAAPTVSMAATERTIDRMSREIGSLRLTEAQVQRFNAEVMTIKSRVVAERDQANERAEEQRGLIAALGRPAQGQSEAPETAARRKELEAELHQAEAKSHHADLVLAKIEKILDQLSGKRIEALARTLAEFKPAPLDPRNWVAAIGEAGTVFSAAWIGIGNWLRRLGESDPAVVSGALVTSILAAVGFALGWCVRLGGRRLRARFGFAWGVDAAPPSLSMRIVLAVLDIVLALAPFLLALLMAWRALPADDALPNGVVRALISAAVIGIVAFVAMRATAAHVLAPTQPGWSMMRVAPERGAASMRALTMLIGLVALDTTVMRAAASFQSFDHVVAVWTLFTTLSFTWAAVGVWRSGGYAGASSWHVADLLARVGLVLAPLAAAIGLSVFARHVALGVLGSAVVLGAASLLRRILREELPSLFDLTTRSGQALARVTALAPEHLRLAEFWLSLLLEIGIVVLTIVGFLLVWGATVDDLQVFATRLIDGVKIGSYTFSLADFLLAIGAFILLLSLTRYIQRVLDARVFPRTSLDTGVRHSLRSGLGYIGLVIAGAAAVSTLGLNLSNLAFVAGALSVGIGFGLQNIVNNFVSGLILLIERPIKQGDWVVVGAHQGIVKRINVRATEIETFSRSTVLVPNAEFLQAHVVNWTHKDMSARVEVTVPMPARSADAARIREVLLSCTRNLPHAAVDPQASVVFKDMTLDTYLFEVQVTVAEATKRGGVASELRFRIDAALRAAFPQGLAPPAPST
jgi:small-conductance mechanosensitive channel